MLGWLVVRISLPMLGHWPSLDFCMRLQVGIDKRHFLFENRLLSSRFLLVSCPQYARRDQLARSNRLGYLFEVFAWLRRMLLHIASTIMCCLALVVSCHRQARVELFSKILLDFFRLDLETNLHLNGLQLREDNLWLS